MWHCCYFRGVWNWSHYLYRMSTTNINKMLISFAHHLIRVCQNAVTTHTIEYVHCTARWHVSYIFPVLGQKVQTRSRANSRCQVCAHIQVALDVFARMCTPSNRNHICVPYRVISSTACYACWKTVCTPHHICCCVLTTHWQCADCAHPGNTHTRAIANRFNPHTNRLEPLCPEHEMWPPTYTSKGPVRCKYRRRAESGPICC